MELTCSPKCPQWHMIWGLDLERSEPTKSMQLAGWEKSDNVLMLLGRLVRRFENYLNDYNMLTRPPKP